MIRKVNDQGFVYHEPPYTPDEEADFYRRVGKGPLAFTRPGFADPKDRQAEQGLQREEPRPAEEPASDR